MDESLKHRLLRNDFAYDLRDSIINREAYTALSAALKELAEQWQHATLVDKQLVDWLFLNVDISRNMADWFAREELPEADEVRDMCLQIERLVMDCLDTSALGDLYAPYDEERMLRLAQQGEDPPQM